MVLCLIVGFRNKSGWDKGLYLAKVPSIIEKQGKEARELSESHWISTISRDDDLSDAISENNHVCDKHFFSGKAIKLRDKFNADWVPTLN